MTPLTRLPGTPEPAHRWRLPNGLVLAGDSWGDEHAPLVLLLHGGGQTRHSWKGVGRALADAGYRAIAFDARGHGDSSWASDADYTQDAMVDDLVSLVEILGSPRPALVGASMGGGTSLAAIGDGCVDATALVLVDIAPRLEADGAEKIVGFMSSRPEGYATVDEAADSIAAYQPHRPRPRDLGGLSKNLRRAPDGRYVWHWDPRFVQPAREYQQREDRLCASARAVKVPALIVRGVMSDILSEAGAREFLELCPHAEYVSIDGAAHMIAGDRNDVFGAAVIDFLKRNLSTVTEGDRGGEHRHTQLPRRPIVDVP
jgi:pimeloyl-ACP methyl ester carboxylesterase